MELKLIECRSLLLLLIEKVESALAIESMVELANKLLYFTGGITLFECFSVHLYKLGSNFSQWLSINLVQRDLIVSFGTLNEPRDIEIRLQREFKRFEIVIDDFAKWNCDWEDLGRKFVKSMSSLDKLDSM